MAKRANSKHSGNGHGRVPTLLAIGGHEERSGDMKVLREFAGLVQGSKVVVATLASSVAPEMWKDYHRAFTELKLKPVHLDIENRIDAVDDPRLNMLDDAAGIFFTGGDQLALTSKLGGTALCERMHELYGKGVVVAGTSAGASVLTETMIVAGESEESHKIGSALQMAPGLGFMLGVVIDQHFAQRGRVARLLGVVAQNPRALGIGIDENTGIVISGTDSFRVVGAGAVYVLDGRPATYTNISETVPDKTLSVFDVRMHLLSDGDSFDLKERRPIPPSPEAVKAEADASAQHQQ